MAQDRKTRAYTPRQIFLELRKVKWPTFLELTKSSLLVILFTILFGVYFFVCELLSTGMIQKIISL